MSSGDAQSLSLIFWWETRYSNHILRFIERIVGEVVKLQQHLVLLREEFVKLQQRYKTLERNYNVLNSTTKLDQNSFVYRLLRIVADLFNKELYRYDNGDKFFLYSRFHFSDISVKLDGETLFGHRFILAARSIKWDPQQLGNDSVLDLSGNKIRIFSFEE